MNTSLTSQQFLRIAAIIFVALAAAVALIQSQRGEDAAVLMPLGRGEPDAHASELARCRTITPDDTAVLESCRRIWAENRQHFFLSTKPPQLPAALTSGALAVPVKGQDRVPSSGVDQGGAR
jgi:conjugative transfer region protein TrbK